jgi:hypothetical protein
MRLIRLGECIEVERYSVWSLCLSSEVQGVGGNVFILENWRYHYRLNRRHWCLMGYQIQIGSSFEF